MCDGLEEAHDKHFLLDEFGASWRITPPTSLLVYPPGKNTYSYIVKRFPRRAISASRHPAASGRRRSAACRRAHVTNAALLAGCVVDVGATGEKQLAACTGRFQHATGLPPTAPRGLSDRWSGEYSDAFNGTFARRWNQSGLVVRGHDRALQPA